MSAMFAAKCPLDTWEKTWVETWMRWLAEQFGIQRLLRAELVLPTERYFPEPYHGTTEDAQRVLGRLCYYLGMNPERLRVEVAEEGRERVQGSGFRVQEPEVATSGEVTSECPEPRTLNPEPSPAARTVLRVARSQLADPQRLAAALARELSKELLLASGLLSEEVPEHEWVTDLLPVYLGLGVFTANATIVEEQYHDGRHTWRTFRKQGSLPARTLGYALALFALMRRDERPRWAKYLRPDARAMLRASLRWLRGSKDSLFHPDTIHLGYRPPSAHEAAARLRSGSPTVRLATLWEISRHGLQSPGLLAAVMDCLEDPDPVIPGEAARALAAFGPAAEAAVPGLVQALEAANERTRAGAAYALGALGLQPEVVVPELRFHLGLGSRGMMSAAAAALGRFGPRAESAIGDLLGAFTAALVDCDHWFVDIVAQALLAITPDPERHVDEYYAEGDPELRQLALDALDELRGAEDE